VTATDDFGRVGAPSSTDGSTGSALIEELHRKIAEIRRLRDRAVKSSPVTVDSVVGPMAEIDMILDEGLSEAELFECVHPDTAVRKAAEICKQEFSKVSSELALDRALYDSFATLEGKTTSDPITDRYIAHALRDFRRAGVDRDEKTRKKIQQIKEELVLLAQGFNRNIREDTHFIELTSPSELAGMPADYVASHEPDANGTIRITTDYPDFVPFMNYARDATLRRKLYIEYLNRAYPVNDAVLRDIFKKRHELAGLVGHDCYASFAAADKMIGSAPAIIEFVDRIGAVAKEQSASDTARLLLRKQQDVKDAETVEDFETAYYSELVRTESLHFDSQEVRPYLEYGRVKAGVLGVACDLFGLSFQPVPEPAWHPSVETFDVFEENEKIGRIYLDMHPRESKYKHAAMFPLLSGVKGVRLPRAVLVCNFPSPSKDRPALLEHSDVVTFFHEFGHLLHHILGGHTPYARFSGVACEWDFVEVPSQFLEEWAFSFDALRRFAVHFETNAPIPEDMVKRLNLANTFGRGSRVSRQMFYAALSYRYHSEAPNSTPLIDVLRETQERYSPYRHMEGTYMHASFGHLEGYSALYYTYMWSLVIVRDLLQHFAKQGMFDKAEARKYREAVLKPGGTKDAQVLIRDFLSREYDFKAFSEWVNTGGLTVS
jgi:thimet oligopeptidase